MRFLYTLSIIRVASFVCNLSKDSLPCSLSVPLDTHVRLRAFNKHNKNLPFNLTQTKEEK